MFTVLPYVNQSAQRRLVESALPNAVAVDDSEPKLSRLVTRLLRRR